MKNFSFWLRLCIFNFFIVSVLGVMMRYNIAFSLPGFNHKFMHEAHSHFAFYGWVAAGIYLFVTNYLARQVPEIRTAKYQYLMGFNQLASYGMLVAFLYGGYYWLSIAFSSVALLSGFVYFIFLMADTRKNNDEAVVWLRTAAFFAVFSSVGIFALAYGSAGHHKMEELSRTAAYFYLHYQYNGFFLFSCIGLLIMSMKRAGVEMSKKENRNILSMLFIGAFFGFGLSVLWMRMPPVLYWFFACISCLQLVGAAKLGLFVWSNRRKLTAGTPFVKRLVLACAGFALLTKFILQSASALPALGEWVFGSITIVIAYLHLVLLMGISLFLIWFIVDHFSVKKNWIFTVSTYALVFGIVLNEIALVLAGVLSAFSVPFVHAAHLLLFASVIVMLALVFFLRSMKLR